MQRTGPIVAAIVLALGVISARADDDPIPPPPPLSADAAGAAPPASPSSSPAQAPDPLLERFRKMEEMNTKLLKEVERLSKQNESLSKKVEGLSETVKDSSRKEKEKAQADADSGIAGQSVGKPRPPAPAGGERQPAESGARSSGARLLPDAQVVGYRNLGKIPLKAYYDYARDGVGLATADDEFLLKFRAEFQADSLIYTGPAQDPVKNGFYLPRVRYYFQGHFTKPIDYQLSFQRSYTTFGFLNVFLNFSYDPRFQFRIGRMKAPYTYEWYKLNNWRFITPERSLFAANFGLNRMIGAMAWGELFERRMEYAVGIFDGPRNSQQDYNSSKDVIAFLNFRPFDQPGFEVLKNVNIGGSMDYGSQDNPLQPAVLRTNVNASTETLGGTDPINNATVPFLAFNNGVLEKGNRELWELHLAYFYQGLSLIATWDGGFNGMAAAHADPVRLPVGGYQVSLAYLITGETLNERTVVDPIHRFDLRPGKFGLGAFEPFVRYAELNVGNQVFTRGLADPNLWTDRVQMTDVGMNWYLNRAVKVYFDWERAMFAQSVYYRPGALHKVSDLFWMRFQLYF